MSSVVRQPRGLLVGRLALSYRVYPYTLKPVHAAGHALRFAERGWSGAYIAAGLSAVTAVCWLALFPGLMIATGDWTWPDHGVAGWVFTALPIVFCLPVVAAAIRLRTAEVDVQRGRIVFRRTGVSGIDSHECALSEARLLRHRVGVWAFRRRPFRGEAVILWLPQGHVCLGFDSIENADTLTRSTQYAVPGLEMGEGAPIRVYSALGGWKQVYSDVPTED